MLIFQSQKNVWFNAWTLAEKYSNKFISLFNSPIPPVCDPIRKIMLTATADCKTVKLIHQQEWLSYNIADVALNLHIILQTLHSTFIQSFRFCTELSSAHADIALNFYLILQILHWTFICSCRSCTQVSSNLAYIALNFYLF